MLRSEDHVTDVDIKTNVVLQSTYGNQPRVKYSQINNPH